MQRDGETAEGTPRPTGSRTVRRITALAILAALLLGVPTTEAANRFVVPGGGGDCSQAAPCSLGQALSVAEDYDSLYLAGGTYTTTGPGAVAEISTLCLLRGGWDGSATGPPVIDPAAYPTVLDGEHARRGVSVSGSTGVLLKDLTIRNGFDPLKGGGIYADAASLLVANVTVENCGADSGDDRDTAGGGLFLSNGSLTLISSTFSGNGVQCSGCAARDGGGIYVEDADHLEVQGSLFEKNDAWLGSAIRIVNSTRDQASISYTSFDRNGAYLSAYPGFGGYGGGVAAQNCDLTVRDSTFTANRGGNDGGALFVFDGSLSMSRCRLSGNESASSAGIFLQSSTFDIRNVLLAGNQPGATLTAAAGVRLHSSSSGTLAQSTITGVAGAERGRGVHLTAGSSVTATNLILGRLATGIEVDGSSAAALDGTLWGSGAWANGTDTVVASGGSLGTGSVNVSADPGFLASGSGDFHLLASSAARDAGAVSAVVDDLDGAIRDSSPDIGAYEYSRSTAVCSPRLLGERIMADSTYPLRWVAPEEAKTFTILLSTTNGRRWRTLAKNVSGHSYDWAVPRMGGNKAACRVKVVAFDDQGKRIGAAISARFRIDVLFVVDPGRGAAWAGGEQELLFWWSHGTLNPVARVDLSYTINGGRTWKKISPAPSPFDPMISPWNIPLLAKQKDKCRVKVVLRNRAGRVIGSALSDRWFTILPP